jgi:hypothetical protein
VASARAQTFLGVAGLHFEQRAAGGDHVDVEVGGGVGRDGAVGADVAGDDAVAGVAQGGVAGFRGQLLEGEGEEAGGVVPTGLGRAASFERAALAGDLGARETCGPLQWGGTGERLVRSTAGAAVRVATSSARAAAGRSWGRRWNGRIMACEG